MPFHGRMALASRFRTGCYCDSRPIRTRMCLLFFPLHSLRQLSSSKSTSEETAAHYTPKALLFARPSNRHELPCSIQGSSEVLTIPVLICLTLVAGIIFMLLLACKKIKAFVAFALIVWQAKRASQLANGLPLKLTGKVLEHLSSRFQGGV